MRLVASVIALMGFLTLAVILILPSVTGPEVNEGSGSTLNLPDPDRVYDPTEFESLPSGYRQVLRRDAIAPIYDPQFTSAGEAEWDDDILVLGVALQSDARAYPINVLNRREIVIDRVGGVPIIASW